MSEVILCPSYCVAVCFTTRNEFGCVSLFFSLWNVLEKRGFLKYSMSGKISSLIDKGLFLKNTFCCLAYKMPVEVCAK